MFLFDQTITNPPHYLHYTDREVERVLSLVDGVLLVVDSNGPKPQTRFVIKKVSMSIDMRMHVYMDAWM